MLRNYDTYLGGIMIYELWFMLVVFCLVLE